MTRTWWGYPGIRWLVVDEPTDLPEGAEVEIVVIDDKLTTEERVELHASLDRVLDHDVGRSLGDRRYGDFGAGAAGASGNAPAGSATRANARGGSSGFQ